ncbi:hypothetical protein [Enterococcus wangshanyuanii]|uniref:Uncharacterized protein n=1 Tax=Enterococcus wangshanyuanii TaxID=2005703 RepID=A0ABQ1NT42_9ENTE|nr:hypothetical protein [Enterococcus wangshanyuanii]GGC84524.1 hypothetical protein GCM10011573_12720 [Enterococcus wangshanyuanii]
MNSNDLLKQTHSANHKEKEPIDEKELSITERLNTIQEKILKSIDEISNKLNGNPIVRYSTISQGIQIYSELEKLRDMECASPNQKVFGNLRVGGVEISQKGIGVKKGSSELAEPILEARNIMSGTLKAIDINEKLDKLSVLGTIDRYAAEQAEDRMKKAAQISDSAAQFKKFITIDRLWESATGEVERMLEIAVQNKIEEMITNKTDSDKSKNDALNELFEEYKLSEDD